MTQDRRGGKGEDAAPVVDIGPADSTGLDLNPDLAIPGFGDWDIPDFEGLTDPG